MTVWLTDVCTEREPGGRWTDCTWASGVMLANEAYGAKALPQTRREYEALRAASGDLVGGSNTDDLKRGMTARYGWEPATTVLTWAQLKSQPVGTAWAVQGLYGRLTTHLRRWDPTFTGAHCTMVVKYGAGKWKWFDPLATQGYAGEDISEADLERYFSGLSSAGGRAVGVVVGGREPMKITKWQAEPWTPDGARRPVRREPVRASSDYLGWVELGKVIMGTAEITTPDGNIWRGVKFNGQVGYILRGDFKPNIPGGDPRYNAPYQAILAGGEPPVAVDCAAVIKQAVDATVSACNVQVAALNQRIATIKAKTATNAADIADD